MTTPDKKQLPLDTARLQAQDNHVVHPWEDFKTIGQNRRTIVGRSPKESTSMTATATE